MTFTRKNIYNLGDDWAPEILWYARAVQVMQQKGLDQHLSWRFYAGIHGFEPEIWQALGWYTPGEPMPSSADQSLFWDQCQHGSWYFLPWHRGYLISIEAVLRAWIVANNGPADWALPYWNYMNAAQDALPPAFASPTWPDGNDNPLYRKERWGPNNDGKVVVPPNQVNLNALGVTTFAGSPTGDPGFGGVETNPLFSHSGGDHGDFEQMPHDQVHGLVGGEDPNSDPNNPLPGLMSDPDTAGLDPIFYLHHCNIDRLWAVWLGLQGGRANPVDPNWLDGPPLAPPVGGQSNGFVVPATDGSPFVFQPFQVADLSTLNYSYDDLSPPVTVRARRQVRAARLGLAPADAAAAQHHAAQRGERAVAARRTELLGANQAPIRVEGEVDTRVSLAPPAVRRVQASFAAATAQTHPDRVFLKLENVRGRNDAKRFSVYVNLPEGADPADHPGQKAGSIALFGVRKASDGDRHGGGGGVNFTLEITRVLDELHLRNALGGNDLSVRIVPDTPVRSEDEIEIGRIGVYRQEG
jgi:tyrosinase